MTGGPYERLRGTLSDEEFAELLAMLRTRRDLPDPGAARLKPSSAERSASKPSKRRQYGKTWWGKAWVDALEHKAHLDPNRLPRGRTYARQNRVMRLEVEPGLVTAFVQGSRARPYRVQLGVRRLGQDQWDGVLDAIAAKAAHAAALLDGDLDPGVVQDAELAGVDLLPGPGELSPECSCPDWADPCKHSAAVCYLVADELDADPFNLLLLRGKPRNEVLAAIRARRRRQHPDSARRKPDRSDGVTARELFAADREPVDRDALLRLGNTDLGPVPGRPPPLAVDPPEASGIDASDLDALATDAACRAHAMLTDGADSGLELSEDSDLVRRAASVLFRPSGPSGGDQVALARLARRARRPLRQLEREATAWHHGGQEGLEVLDESWDPSAEQIEEGRRALSRLGGRVRARGNRLTAGEVQLRLARSGCWYRLDDDGGQWEISRGPCADPDELV